MYRSRTAWRIKVINFMFVQRQARPAASSGGRRHVPVTACAHAPTVHTRAAAMESFTTPEDTLAAEAESDA